MEKKTQKKNCMQLRRQIRKTLGTIFLVAALVVTAVPIQVAKAETEKTTYTVTFFDWDDSVIMETKVQPGEDAVPPENPERDGYIFKGWRPSFTNITQDTGIWAQYEKVENTVSEYLVTFYDWDGELLYIQKVSEGGDAILPVNPVREGYIFKGWSPTITNITKDTDVFAQYEKVEAENTRYTWDTLIGKNKTTIPIIPKDCDTIYTTADGVYQFAYVTDSATNTKKIAVILGYNANTLENNYLEIPEVVDAYTKFGENEGSRTGYVAVSKSQKPLYYISSPTTEDVSAGNIVQETVYSPCYAADNDIWGSLPLTEFYYKDELGNFVKTELEVDQWIKNLDVMYIGNQSLTVNPTVANTDGAIQEWIIAEESGELNATPENGVFANESNIKTLVVGDNLLGIGNYAFYGCTNLEYIQFGKGLNEMGKFAFANCVNMTDIDIDVASGLQYISDYTFLNCRALNNVILPLSVTKIYENAFENCSELVTIEIPKEVGVIGNAAFYGCSSLNAIEIPEKVTEIGYKAFYNCSGLTSIEIPEGITEIGIWTFYNCSGLTSIEIPEGVTKIGDRAFYNCSGLTSIKIPEGITEIGAMTFRNCSSLTSIEVPKGVTKINSAAFYGCSGLVSIEIPEGVTEICGGAFYGCSNLMSIIIPESVVQIANDTFNDCHKTTIYGYRGSYAETYAKENNIPFVDMTVISATDIFFNITQIIMRKGASWCLKVTMEPTDTTDKITWTSSAPNVATVSGGEITAVAAGKATIIATTTSGKTAACEVTVVEETIQPPVEEPKEIPATNVTLNKTKVNLNKGKTLTLTATMAPSDTTDEITWKSSNKKVASITVKDNKAVVTALKKGTATITATTTSGKSVSCVITVKETKATKVKLNKAKVTINKGKTVTVKATLTPGNSTDNIKWTTSNKKVAQITANGKKATISGLKKGTVTITAKTDSGKKATCKITVKEIKATKIKLNKTKATIKKGKTLTLKATLTPKNSTDTVTWKSSNNKVAKVSDKGKVTAVKKGTATITAKISSGKKVTCKITVK